MDKIRLLFSAMTGSKKKMLLVLLAVGALLILISIIPGGSAEEKDTLDNYKARLEAELAELCSGVEGAGRCIVSVSFSEGEQLEYKGSTLIGKRPPRVQGITVLAVGGARASVRSDITEMLSALYDIGKNRICVLKLST